MMALYRTQILRRCVGITRFADMSQTEFETRYLGASTTRGSSKPGGLRGSGLSSSDAHDSYLPKVADATEHYASLEDVNRAFRLQTIASADWSTGSNVFTTAVKDQGYCVSTTLHQ